MSDLYMVLRSRIPQVAEWVNLGEDVMRDALKRQGLSAERAARQIPVSEKTFRRYIEKGAVPVHMLDKVADILDLEIERSARRRVQVTLEPDIDAARGLQQEVADLTARAERIERMLRQLLEAQRPTDPEQS